jgi:uncharacterized membrane protein
MTPLDLYPWLKAAHVAMAVIFVGGLLMESVVLWAAARPQVGSGPESTLAPFLRAARRWDHSVTGPALLLVWALGLTLAIQGHWFRSFWLPAKLVVVVALSALHGFQSGALRRLAGGGAAAPGRVRDLAGPAIVVAVVAIALLAVLKPR